MIQSWEVRRPLGWRLRLPDNSGHPPPGHPPPYGFPEGNFWWTTWKYHYFCHGPVTDSWRSLIPVQGNYPFGKYETPGNFGKSSFYQMAHNNDNIIEEDFWVVDSYFGKWSPNFGKFGGEFRWISFETVETQKSSSCVLAFATLLN